MVTSFADGTKIPAAGEVKALASELKKYDAALAKKPRWLVMNKADLLEIPDDPYDESMWHDAQSEAQHAL